MSGEPDDVQSGTCPVGAVDQAAIVELHVVGLNHLGAGGSDLRIAGWMADSIRAERHRVLVRCGDEIGDLLHGKRVAHVKNARARVEPREDGQLSVIRGIKQLGTGVCTEPPAFPAEVSVGHAERRNVPWRHFAGDVHEECQVRCRTVFACGCTTASASTPRTWGAVIAAGRFRRNDQEVPFPQ